MLASGEDDKSTMPVAIEHLAIVEPPVAKPIFPVEVMAFIVNILVQEEQYETAGALSRCSRAILAASIPHLYRCVKLGNFGSLVAFLDHHPSLRVEAIALGSHASRAPPEKSSDMSCRLSRGRLYHSSIQHLDINLRSPMNIAESDLEWFTEAADFPEGHHPIKLDSVHITHQPNFGPYYPRQRDWLRVILRMFQAKHFRWVGGGVGHWVPVDRSLEICGRHILSAWDYDDHLESIDIPVLLEKVPRRKFRWVLSDNHERFLGSPLWGEILDYLEDDVVLPAASDVSGGPQPQHPTCLVYNAPASFSENLDNRVANHLVADKRPLATRLFSYVNDGEPGLWTSSTWRRWLKSGIWKLDSDLRSEQDVANSQA